MISLVTRLILVVASLMLDAMPAVAEKRQRHTGEATHFDFAIETSDGVATLYLARKPFNEPLAGHKPQLVPDDEKLPAISFEEGKEPGVYTAKYGTKGFPEGQLEVTVNGVTEAVDAEVVGEDGHGGHEGHDHSHGVARKSAGEMLKSTPVVAAGLFAFFLLGLFLGRLGRRQQAAPLEVATEMVIREQGSGDVMSKTSVLLFGIFAAASTTFPKPAWADEGHSHGGVEISSAAAAGEVEITKKSQFLLNLRTQPAVKGPVKESIETFGHLTPKPSLDAMVRAPASGFLHLASESLLGSQVRKGQSIGHIEGIGAINLQAPISGTVVEVATVPGTRLESGAPILRIVDTTKLWIDAEVFQKDLARLRGSETALVRLEGESSVIAGKILHLKSIVDEKTLTAKVYLEIDNPQEQLALGALANVSFILSSSPGEGMSFPKGTVLNRGGEKIVFVQTGVESFVAKPVATRFGSEPGVDIVTKGLEEGERVVTSGGYQLLVGAN